MRATRVGVVLLLAACGREGGAGGSAGGSEQETAAARQAIEAANAEFIQHFVQGHGDIVAGQYTEDAQLMMAGVPVAKGRQQIAATFNSLAPMKPALTLTVDKVTVSGPMALERGTYALTITPPGAPGPATETGSYLVHWHKVGDKWIRVDDIGTSEKPFPPAPAPAPAPTPASTK
jgi:ketosteroid isomerase-like protein